MIHLSSILEIAARSAIVYLVIILGIKVFGKKELSQLSVIDLVFILLISNSVQNAMVGPDSSLIGGVTAALTLFIINSILKRFLFFDKKVSKWIQGSPVVLIHDGKIIEQNLSNEKITIEELKAAIREHGVESVSDVNLAMLEVDGNISVLSDNFKSHTKKRRKVHKNFLS